MILAVDLGVRTGLALFNTAGELQWVRSGNFGNAARLKKAVPSYLDYLDKKSILVMEGGGILADIWEKEAKKRGLSVIQIHAGDWRKDILYARNQRNAASAKHHAVEKAMEIIRNSAVSAPKSITDDAAEAFLVGYWFINYYLK